MSDSAVLEPSTVQSPENSPPKLKLTPPWSQIETDYIRGGTCRELSRKYSVPINTVIARCHRGEWQRKRDLANAITQQSEGAIKPYIEQSPNGPMAIATVDLLNEALKWKERTYKTAVKLADGLDCVDAQSLGSSGRTKALAEAASALASIDATARRQLGLDAQDSEDFGGVARHTGRPGERPIMRRAQVIDVAPAEVSTPEAFDPGI